MSRRLPNPLPVLRALRVEAGPLGPPLAGFSGATIWKVGAAALKAYPPDFDDLPRLASIHQSLRAAGGIMPEPLAGPWEDQGRLWDLVAWRDGTPLTAASPASSWRLAGERLAELHGHWRSGPRSARPPACVLRHWQAIAEGGVARTDFGFLPELIERVRSLLKPWLNREAPVQTVHGDLWPGNVLLAGEAVSGMIDHGSIRVDSPVADLARLAEVHEAETVAGYESIRPLSVAECELLAALRQSGPAVRLLRWLAWRAAGAKFADSTAAEARFQVVVAAARRLAAG